MLSTTRSLANIITNTGTETTLRAFHEAVGEVTTNISKVIDDNLRPLSELLRIHREELDSHEKRITETEHRISVLEEAADGKIESTGKYAV